MPLAGIMHAGDGGFNDMDDVFAFINPHQINIELVLFGPDLMQAGLFEQKQHAMVVRQRLPKSQPKQQLFRRLGNFRLKRDPAGKTNDENAHVGGRIKKQRPGNQQQRHKNQKQDPFLRAGRRRFSRCVSLVRRHRAYRRVCVTRGAVRQSRRPCGRDKLKCCRLFPIILLPLHVMKGLFILSVHLQEGGRNMMKTTLVIFLSLALSLASATSAPAASSIAPVVIDHFVAGLFPKASRYFWVVNATREDTQREIIVDLNTFVTPEGGDTPLENRFLILILDGEVLAAQNIPVDSSVDCGKEEAV